MIIKLVKEWILPGSIIAVLYFTGIFGQFTTFAQSMFLKTGLFNVDAEYDGKENFDFNQKAYNMEGELINFNEFKGKVIFLNLWASWCGPCKAEMPGINHLYEELKENTDIEFIMLSIDKNEEAPHRFIRKNKLTFPYYHWNGSMTNQLSVRSIPTTFVISKSGEIIKREVGMANYNTKSFRKFLLKEASK